MNSKIFLVLFVCLVAVAVKGAFLEESREDTGIALERCDPHFCDSEKVCRECCAHNYYLDHEAAEGDLDRQHQAMDALCACGHYITEKLHAGQ